MQYVKWGSCCLDASFFIRYTSQVTSIQLRSCRVGFLRSSARQIADVGDPSAKPQPVSLGITTEYHGVFVSYLRIYVGCGMFCARFATKHSEGKCVYVQRQTIGVVTYVGYKQVGIVVATAMLVNSTVFV